MSPPAAPSGRLLLIRHGETEWSRAGRHTGHTDVPLTPQGERQAAALRMMLAGRRFVLVATSPRRRATHTADLAGLVPAVPPESGGSPAGVVVKRRVVWPELVEWDYGDYEGVTTARIRQDVPGWTVFGGNVPGGESAEQVGARADLVLARVVPLLEQGDVALVGHSHMLRVLVSRWLEMAPAAGAHLVIEPASLSELGYEHESPVLRRLNTLPDTMPAAPPSTA